MTSNKSIRFVFCMITGAMLLCSVVSIRVLAQPGDSAPLGGTLEGFPVTNLIRNGSFENPVVPSGSYQLFNAGTTFTGWKVVGSGNVAIVSGTFTQDGFSFPAKQGSQWLDLTGTSNTFGAGVEQSVATTPGATYTLTFYVGNVYDPDGIFGVTSTVNVDVNGHQVFSATNSQQGTTMIWQKFTTSITATASHTMISFLNGDPSSDTSNGLDAITLVQAAGDIQDTASDEDR